MSQTRVLQQRPWTPQRKRHTVGFKAMVASGAIRGERAMAGKCESSPPTITGGKRIAIGKMASVSGSGPTAALRIAGERSRDCTQDRASCDRAGFLPAAASPIPARKVVRQDHPGLDLRRQCSLVSPARSWPYCQSLGESAGNPAFMEIIDRQFLEAPRHGLRQMIRNVQREGLDADATGPAG